MPDLDAKDGDGGEPSKRSFCICKRTTRLDTENTPNRNRQSRYEAVPAITGGGSEVLVLESNQNHARALDTEICPTLPAAMGLGGGYVPMVVINDDENIQSDKPECSVPSG